MVRDERTVVRAGMTLHGAAVPGALLVRVMNDDTEQPDTIVIARNDRAEMAGMMLGRDGSVIEWVPYSAWVVAYHAA